MSIRFYGFGNLGRDKGPKSTNGIDMDALMALRVNTPDVQAAIFLCEINEGDDNDELRLVQRVFKDWQILCRGTREPILLSPDQPKAKSKVFWVPDTAVRNWSPPRSVNVVHLQDEPETLIGCHPAAGANGQGDRPKWAREPLQISWDNTLHKMNSLKLRFHNKGRNVTTQIDANAYDKVIYRLMPGEQEIWHDDTDHGRAWPVEGFVAAFHDTGKVDFKIDSHDGHTMRGRYIKR